ncbi:DUF3857 domain-containing protein [Alteriqipengyuania lutimaris]|uniref:DUF3857 domain-containing protein n=1 Tax=Alteriqipengyuania lutimaris TaxID=1538146 RepID=A0A395LHU3_9SPHN|nr:DUF3857 domain-containing protein [Alteriqipengyuania lutimaris]MBB3035201.1 tetratricopeptide (TPR) repeat protein/alkylated DNA nucleotide flippase Atl1 [Alteriqipengyuania lutimaris]RDS75807.1 DUF3857 domain-containing protein [Alteriqipengyuania lutimaris]
MRHIYLASAATGLVAAALSVPAQAGETILYEDEAAWVDVADLPPASESQGLPLRLIETQTRMEDGLVSTYGDIAFALDSPEALNSLGTISLEWLPDKGDLTVHRVELVRDGEVIDLLAGGARFEVLRREERLEERILDGVLTATMSVSGTEIGDVLRYSFTSSKDEQILDEDMEFASIVQAKPAPIAAGRTILSWPVDEAVHWRTDKVSPDAATRESGGYRYVTISLPVDEAKDIPEDAPARFRLPPSVRASTFENYAQISDVIAPYFATGGTIEPGGALADKVAEIAGRTPDPRERAALATQFVQDEIGYLLNGLDGGNYIPQSPAETWEARTGDCKAKSLLLLAMLRELGISAEAVLVHSQTGDALPELLPALGNFDHMIVRADIDGTAYWLDGTSGGLRLSNMIEVPRFRYSLPLRDGGTDLQEMAMRPQAIPDEAIALTIDQSAGIDVPAIYDITIRVSGVSAQGYESLSLVEDADQKEAVLTEAVRNVIGDHQPAEMNLAFDRDTGMANLSARGLVTSPWEKTDGRFELGVPYQVIEGFDFDVDRSRPEIAELPVMVRGPVFFRRNIEWLLPQGEGEFRLLGQTELNEVVGGTRLFSEAELGNGRLSIAEEVQSLAWEVPASDLPEVRRRTLRVERGLPRLRASGEAKRAFEYRGADRARLKPIAELYSQLIADADPDDADVYANRSTFRYYTGDFEGARADMDAAIARDATADSYILRGAASWQLGDLEAALADYEAAAQIDPDYSLNGTRLEVLALLGRNDEAIALLDEHAYLFEEPKHEAMARSYTLGFSDRQDEGLALLRDELAIEPDDAGLLNSLCWDSGIFDRVTEQTLEICTRAVEESGNGAGAIDSRALALYRLGRYEEALRDLDVALAREPAQHGSRYLRGVVKRALGNKADARADIELALHASPGLAPLYSEWGLPPK